MRIEVAKPKQNRPSSPVAQSPLLMPMLQVKKLNGNESVCSKSSRGGTLLKPPLKKKGGVGSRLKMMRPKIGLGSGSQQDMISTRSF